jgi:hypothetical protein
LTSGEFFVVIVGYSNSMISFGLAEILLPRVETSLYSYNEKVSGALLVRRYLITPIFLAGPFSSPDRIALSFSDRN